MAKCSCVRYCWRDRECECPVKDLADAEKQAAEVLKSGLRVYEGGELVELVPPNKIDRVRFIYK